MQTNTKLMSVRVVVFDTGPDWHLLTCRSGVGRTFETVCLFLCLQHNSKTKDPKVLKLVIGNDLGIS